MVTAFGALVEDPDVMQSPARLHSLVISTASFGTAYSELKLFNPPPHHSPIIAQWYDFRIMYELDASRWRPATSYQGIEKRELQP
jgi:hypothetical protein